jgi:hypothetical protein
MGNVRLTVAGYMGVRLNRPRLPLSVECADLIRCHGNPFLSFDVYYVLFVVGNGGNGGCTLGCSRGGRRAVWQRGYAFLKGLKAVNPGVLCGLRKEAWALLDGSLNTGMPLAARCCCWVLAGDSIPFLLRDSRDW